jgi:hypothetical protein
MTDDNMPNRSANQEKAEGDRDTAARNQDTDRTDAGAAHPGITNRGDREESSNQERVPRRGDTKNGGHA